MQIIKEYCKYANRAVIRSNSYGSGLSKFEELFEIARKDFPFLKISDVDVVHFAGERYAKTFGIEFNVLSASVPSDYIQISQLEYTY